MSELTDALEEWKKISTKETPENVEDKKEHPLWYIYRNSVETQEKWWDVKDYIETDNDRKLVMKACMELLDNEKTNGNALDEIGHFSRDCAEKLKENPEQSDLDYILQLSDLIVKIDIHPDVEDSEMKSDMNYAASYFHLSDIHTPQVARKICERYIDDVSAIKTRLFKHSIWKIADSQQDTDFLKSVKQKLSSPKVGEALGVKEANSLIAKVNFALLDKEPDNKDLLYETWARIKTLNNPDKLMPMIQRSANDSRVMQEIAEYMIKHKIMKREIVDTFMESASRHITENQSAIKLLFDKSPSKDIISSAIQNKNNTDFYKLCTDEIIKRMDTQFNVSHITEDVIKLPEISQHILTKMGENFSELSDKKTASNMVNVCNAIIAEHPTNKGIAKSVLDVANNLAEKKLIDIPTQMQIYEKINKNHPLLINSQKEKEKFAKKLEDDFKQLLKDGNIYAALDKLITKRKLQHDEYMNGNSTFMYVTRDQLRSDYKKMSNGCIAIGFLCEDREWNKEEGTYGGGIAWKWYAEGLIIDPEKADIVRECQTSIVTVRHPYDARQDIYNNINMEDFMSVDGDKVEVYVGRYSSASMEYKKNTKEDELAQIISDKLQELKGKTHTDNIEDIPHAKTQILREVAKDNLGKPKRSNADKAVIKAAMNKAISKTRK